MRTREKYTGFKDPLERSAYGKTLPQTHLVPRTPQMKALHDYLSSSPRGEKLASVVNGPETVWMTRKDEFSRRLQEAGIVEGEPPVVVHPQQLPSLEWFTQTFQADAAYYIKPLEINGKGRGVQRVLGCELRQALLAYQEYVMIQPKLDFDREYRWWFYKDVQGTSWRIVYEKVHPRVEGTGDEELFQLILRERHIPLVQRARLLARHSERLFDKPEFGEVVQLNQGVGSRSNGTYEQLLDPQDSELLYQLDTQAAALMQQLAVMSSVPELVHAVFDLGWNERLQKIVPIEFQFPYSTRWWSYANHNPALALVLETAMTTMLLREHADKPQRTDKELATW